jgi:hypothetical protein
MTNDIVPINNNQSIIPKQADTDEQVIALWLHGRSRSWSAPFFGPCVMRVFHTYSPCLEEGGA